MTPATTWGSVPSILLLTSAIISVKSLAAMLAQVAVIAEGCERHLAQLLFAF